MPRRPLGVLVSLLPWVAWFSLSPLGPRKGEHVPHLKCTCLQNLTTRKDKQMAPAHMSDLGGWASGTHPQVYLPSTRTPASEA